MRAATWRRSTVLAGGQGAGTDRRRHDGVGFAGDLRIPGRAVSGKAAVAGRPPRARALRARSAPKCTPDFRVAQPDADERARSFPGMGMTPRCGRDIARIVAIWSDEPAAIRRAVSVRWLQHRRRDVCAGGDALRDLCGRVAGRSRSAMPTRCSRCRRCRSGTPARSRDRSDCRNTNER